MNAVTPVSPDLARSWLLVSGGRSDLFNEASTSMADQVILDLEDAVDAASKPQARVSVQEWLSTGGEAWVRINPRSSEFWSDDIDAITGAPGLRGVVLAKTESGTEVSETFDRLGANKPVIPLLESALGIEEAVAVARANGAFRLAFGSGDYRRDTGVGDHDLALVYPRTRLVLASRIGQLPGPVDGPTVGASRTVLREQAALAASLGLTGKLCLDLAGLSEVNEAIGPAPSEVAWARQFLDGFESRGRVVRDGSEPPRLARAQKIDRIARALGLVP